MIVPGDIVHARAGGLRVVVWIHIVDDRWHMWAEDGWLGPHIGNDTVGICVSNPDLPHKESPLHRVFYCVFPTAIGWVSCNYIEGDEE